MKNPPKSNDQGCNKKPQNPTSVVFQTISEDQSGQRVDNFLLCYLKGVPKSHIYKILRKGEVRVNKGRIKPTYRLKANDILRIPPVRGFGSEEASKKTFKNDSLLDLLEKRVLFEDEGLLIINKPSGLAVHGGSGISHGLIEALRVMRPECEGLELVHRLDRDTSGCVMLSKKRSVLRELHELLRGDSARKVKKKYTALLTGRWQGREHLIEAPLKKNVMRSGERIVRVSSEGKDSQTRFKIIRQFKDSTLVEAMPITGRTHQIRVHAQFSGHPILGDNRYGDELANKLIKQKGLNRLFLHAASLDFKLESTGQVIKVSAPLDSELKEVLKSIGAT